MSFTQAVAHVLRNYVGFNGRARRSEYWWFALFQALVGIVTATIDSVAFGADPFDPNGAFQPTSSLVSLALLLPTIAVTARRLHDIDKSGWWQLIGVIPIVGWILMLVWTIREGTPGDNRFGPSPKGIGGGYGYGGHGQGGYPQDTVRGH